MSRFVRGNAGRSSEAGSGLSGWKFRARRAGDGNVLENRRSVARSAGVPDTKERHKGGVRAAESRRKSHGLRVSNSSPNFDRKTAPDFSDWLERPS